MEKTIIHIGFPKTGSTFLQDYFDAHPDIYHDRRRFEKYRASGEIDSSLQVSGISQPFHVMSEEHLAIWAGDTTNVRLKTHNMTYDVKSHQRKVAWQLSEQFPDARILLVSRGIESLLKSLYSQYLTGGGTRKFSRFVREDGTFIRDLYDYDHVLSAYREFFPPENIVVLPYELLRQDPGGFLKTVETTFGFAHFGFHRKMINKSIPVCMMPLIRLSSRLFFAFVRLWPIERQHEVYLSYKERLYHMKEGWMQRINCKRKHPKVDLGGLYPNAKLLLTHESLKQFQKHYTGKS